MLPCLLDLVHLQPEALLNTHLLAELAALPQDSQMAILRKQLLICVQANWSPQVGTRLLLAVDVKM